MTPPKIEGAPDFTTPDVSQETKQESEGVLTSLLKHLNFNPFPEPDLLDFGNIELKLVQVGNLWVGDRQVLICLCL